MQWRDVSSHRRADSFLCRMVRFCGLAMSACAASQVSAYVACPDVTLTVTPDLKLPGTGRLVHVDLTAGRRRLGGSALAHAYGQVGDAVPDVAPAALRGMWGATQALLRGRKIASGHDISDGGLAVALLEMAFAGNCGLDVELPAPGEGGAFAALYAEEPGLVLEVRRPALVPSQCSGSFLEAKAWTRAQYKRRFLLMRPHHIMPRPCGLHQVATEDVATVLDTYAAAGVGASVVGSVTGEQRVSIAVGDAAEPCIAGSTAQLRDAWEATGFQLERLQVAPAFPLLLPGYHRPAPPLPQTYKERQCAYWQSPESPEVFVGLDGSP